jgi:hypothetical protein
MAHNLIFKGCAHFAIGRVVVTGNGSVERTDVAVVQNEKDARHLLGRGRIECAYAAAGD